ncbi:hypothetical protein P8605_10905 [Streptomyces sp. T-3]|nr:hypothetical protein [Streptomyces sp. T-3]
MAGVKCGFQVFWEPGSDVLTGTCHCGAVIRAEDPVEVWSWLLAHPDHPDHRDHPDRRSEAA